MSYNNLRALLYPQTFLLPDFGKIILPYLSSIIVFQLPSTSEIWEKFYNNFPISWQEKLKFLTLKKDLSIDWEQLKKERKTLEEWGLNFRTPENLKYFSQFKEVLEESLETLLPTIKGVKNTSKQEVEIKKALITLLLAEDLDTKLYEVYISLKEIDQKYNEIFKEKIIGEDLTFQKILDIYYPVSEPYIFFKNLSGLFSRINAWKTVGKYLEWGIYPNLSNLVITDIELLERWKDKFEFKEENISKEIKFYKFKASLFQILEIPLNTSKSQETGVILVTS